MSSPKLAVLATDQHTEIPCRSNIDHCVRLLRLFIETSGAWQQCEDDRQRAGALKFLAGYQVVERSNEPRLLAIAEELGFDVPRGPVELETRCQWFNALHAIAVQAVVDEYDRRVPDAEKLGRYLTS